MNREHTMGDPQELATLYAAGAMTAQEAAAFEAHLDEGCPRCRTQLRQLDDAVFELCSPAPPVGVDPSVRKRLLAQIDGASASAAATQATVEARSPQVWKRWRGDDPSTDWFIQRETQADWEETGIAGIQVRRLFVDAPRNQMTALVRMAAGTSYPRHIHDGPEECLVLEGDLWAGDVEFRKGDYQRMTPGSRHDVQSTKGGCLLLIVSSLSDELG